MCGGKNSHFQIYYQARGDVGEGLKVDFEQISAKIYIKNRANGLQRLIDVAGGWY